MTQEVDEVEQQSHISVTIGGKESNLEIMLASELIIEGFKDPSLTAGQRHKVKPQFACFGALHLTGVVVHMCASECLLAVFFSGHQ